MILLSPPQAHLLSELASRRHGAAWRRALATVLGKDQWFQAAVEGAPIRLLIDGKWLLVEVRTYGAECGC